MANEITITASLAFAKGSVANVSRAITAVQFDVSGTRYSQIVQAVGTGEEALDFGDVPTAQGGYCFMKNLDATNFVEVRPGTGIADLIKMKPLEVCLFRITPAATPWMIADTDPCDVEILIVED